MRILFAAAALMLVSGAAYAADAAPVAEQATARLNLDTSIETIAADAEGKTVLDAALPGLTTHKHYDEFKSMSLRVLGQMAPDKLTAEMLAKAEADLAKVK